MFEGYCATRSGFKKHGQRQGRLHICGISEAAPSVLARIPWNGCPGVVYGSSGLCTSGRVQSRLWLCVWLYKHCIRGTCYQANATRSVKT